MIEILREMVPTASKIAVLVNPGNPIHRLIIAEELPQTARKLGVALPIVEATTAEELDIAFASAAAQHADAIIVFGDPLTFNNATRVTALAAKHRLPAIYLFRLFATNGGLISYGPDLADLFFRAGGYVDKILKGTKPSDLPVEQPTKFELVINMKTAKALGLTVPPSLARPRRRGDRMISAECILSALAHAVISLRCGAWSLWGHSGPMSGFAVGSTRSRMTLSEVVSVDASATPLFFWRKILIGQWRRDWTLNAYKRLSGCRVAAIAAAGKLVEGGCKFYAALCSNRLFNLLYPWIDDGLDHLSDREAVKGWKKPCGVL